jgi:hypothetical protein
MNLDYLTLLSDESRAVYLAKVDDTHVVVKFVPTYSVRAHNLLAEKGLAPRSYTTERTAASLWTFP